MKFYWCANTRAFRIAWLLEELGQPYERVVIDLHQPLAQRPAQFLATSPMGKVPAIEDGVSRLSDSGAICLYLADQYPAAGLAPAIGHADRARYLQWLLFTNSIIEPSMAEKFAKLEPRPTSYGWGSFDLMLATLKAGIAVGPWILGARFSAADVLLGCSCYFLRQFGLVKDDADFDHYIDRCQARPAWQRAQTFDTQ